MNALLSAARAQPPRAVNPALLILPQPVIQFVTVDTVELVEAYRLDLSPYGKPYVITIKREFTSDGASIPRPLRAIEGFATFAGDTMPAALVHDALYASHIVTKAEADDVLFVLMMANGISRARAMIYKRAVQTFGDAVWAKPAETIAENARFVFTSNTTF